MRRPAVVLLQEQLVEVQPGLRVALAELVPVDHVEHGRQRLERGVQRVLFVHLLGQQPQGRADQGVGLAQFLGRVVDAVLQRNLARLGHQQAEGHRLGVAVGELRVVGVREQQVAPVVLQSGQIGRLAGQLLDHLVAQQATEAGGDLGQLPRRAWRDRVPLVEGLEQGQQFGRRLQDLARRFDVAVQPDDLADPFAVAPQTEGVAVRVDQVGKRLELLPLGAVMGFGAESGGVGALARRLDLDKADQGALAGHGEVGPDHQVRQLRLADQLGIVRGQPRQARDGLDQRHQRGPQLVFRLTRDRRIVERRLGRGPEGGDRFVQSAQRLFPPNASITRAEGPGNRPGGWTDVRIV